MAPVRIVSLGIPPIRILKVCAIVAVTGVLIGVFRQWHVLLGGLLFGFWLLYLIRRWSQNPADAPHLLLAAVGMGLNLVAGTLVELWGTQNGHWTYWDLPPGVMVPFWVPVAWAWAYKVVHKVETILLESYPAEGIRKWTLFIILPSIAIPTLGELVAINLGVWSYHWQPQIWGMPPLAAALLGVFHVFVFWAMKRVCALMRVNDLVYAGPHETGLVENVERVRV